MSSRSARRNNTKTVCKPRSTEFKCTSNLMDRPVQDRKIDRLHLFQPAWLMRWWYIVTLVLVVQIGSRPRLHRGCTLRRRPARGPGLRDPSNLIPARPLPDPWCAPERPPRVVSATGAHHPPGAGHSGRPASLCASTSRQSSTWALVPRPETRAGGQPWRCCAPALAAAPCGWPAGGPPPAPPSTPPRRGGQCLSGASGLCFARACGLQKGSTRPEVKAGFYLQRKVPSWWCYPR